MNLSKDLIGNLAFVIPPAATGNITQHMAGHCYQYRYDDKNRLVEKKLPGRDLWDFVVYDRLDRIIATGPAASPFPGTSSSGWHLTKYDVFNRPIISAWLPTSVTSSTRKTLQGQMDALTANFSEAKSANPININGISLLYTNVAWPATTTYHVLTINYYDDYNFTGAPIVFTSTSGPVYFNNSTRKPKGMSTGSWVRVLEGITNYRGDLSYSLFDYMGRVVLSKTVNYLGGYMQTESNMDFSGKTLACFTRQKRVSADSEILLTDTFTYSPQDRLDSHMHKIGTGTSELMSQNTYDDLGRLINKKTGGQDSETYFQKTDYRYNIRGWLTDINNVDDLDEPGTPQDLFAFRIGYDSVVPGMGGVALYNGNISETFWRTATDNIQRKYSYHYDYLNRLNHAIYQKPGSSNPTPDSYNESISYDRNGNITNIRRTGGLDSSSMALQIDDLHYTYADKSNRLLKVTDFENSSQGFADDGDGTNDTQDDYDYDGYGNLTQDQNKQISRITYNHLNLPTVITFDIAGTNNITYLYDALGKKRRKTVKMTGDSTKSTATEYLGGFQYVDGELQFFPTAQGYVRMVDGKYLYVYNMTDHLGNIRLSYTYNTDESKLEIMEENHYYPYGLKHQNYNISKLEYVPGDSGVVLASASALEYKYKFNGQEWQEELGLNLYDMDFRDYDPGIVRWSGIDPIIDFHLSPYLGFDGNPVYYADPSGADVFFYNGAVEADGADAGGFYNALLNAMSGGTSVYKVQGEVYDQTHTEWLPTMTVTRAAFYGYGGGGGGLAGTIQRHVYDNSRFYQSLRDERSLERWSEFSQALQDVGDAMSLVGYGLTLSVVGAEIGIPLAAIGNGIALTGAVIDISSNLYYSNYEESAQGLGFEIAGEFIPKLVRIPGFEYLGNQIMKQNMELKIMGIERIINHQQSQQ